MITGKKKEQLILIGRGTYTKVQIAARFSKQIMK